MDDEPKIEITAENAGRRINAAAETLVSCWDEWQAAADESSQIAQDGTVGDLEMLDYIAVILQGMIFDSEPAEREKGE